MNMLYSVIQFIPLLEIVLRVILYAGVIYILFGPLRKLIKTTIVHLESKKLNVEEVAITPEIMPESIQEESLDQE